MDITDKNPSDEEIFGRLLSLTEAGRLDWKQVYEQGGTAPAENIKESTAPQGYMAFDEYFGFGRVAVKPDDPEDGIEHSVVHVSGTRLDIGAEQVETLISVIESYIDAVQAGDIPSMSDRINRKVQEQVEPLRQEIRVLEEELAHKDNRVGRMLSIIENTTCEGPPMTPRNFREVANRVDFEVTGSREDPNITVDQNNLEVAIAHL